ncbi:MAG: hypothetical protein ABIQ87_13105 [Rubrivivax sp.]
MIEKLRMCFINWNSGSMSRLEDGDGGVPASMVVDHDRPIGNDRGDFNGGFRCDIDGECHGVVGVHFEAMHDAGRPQKKGAPKRVTRLPTDRLATACWAFIVGQSIGREPAPLLDFCPLH